MGQIMNNNIRLLNLLVKYSNTIKIHLKSGLKKVFIRASEPIWMIIFISKSKTFLLQLASDFGNFKL